MKLSGIFAALALAGLAVTSAQAQTTTTTTTPRPTSSSISMTNNCAGGGTRTVTGSYDAATGALSAITTLTACVARNGDKFDGTTSTIGSLLATSTGFTINITANVNTTITRSDLSKVVRVCTSTKEGRFTTANQTFDGTTSQNNCSVTGKVLEHEGLVEHLLRPALGDEESGGREATMRMLPPQQGEDSIREQRDMPEGGMGDPGRMSGSR